MRCRSGPGTHESPVELLLDCKSIDTLIWFWEYSSMRLLRSCLMVVGLFAVERHRDLVRA